MSDWKESAERPALLLTLFPVGSPEGVPYAVAEVDVDIALDSIREVAERFVTSGICWKSEITGCALHQALPLLTHVDHRQKQMVLGHALAVAEGRTEESFDEYYGGKVQRHA